MPNDTCAAAIVVSTSPYTVHLDTSANADDPTVSPSCGSSGGSKAAWWKYTNASSAAVFLRAITDPSASHFHDISMWSGTCGGTLTQVACNNVAYSGKGIDLSITVPAGETRYILITDDDLNTGVTFDLTITITSFGAEYLAITSAAGPAGYKVVNAVNAVDGTYISGVNPFGTAQPTAIFRRHTGHLLLSVPSPDLVELSDSFERLSSVTPTKPSYIGSSFEWSIGLAGFDNAGHLYLLWGRQSAGIPVNHALQRVNATTYAVIDEWRDFASVSVFVSVSVSPDGGSFFYSDGGYGGASDGNVIYRLNLGTSAVTTFGSYGSYTGGTNAVGDYAQVISPLSSGKVLAYYGHSTDTPSPASDGTTLVLFSAAGSVDASVIIDRTFGNSPAGLVLSPDESAVWLLDVFRSSIGPGISKYTVPSLSLVYAGTAISDTILFGVNGIARVPDTSTPVAPIPLPTPLAPQTPCDPQAQVSGGGTGASGCNDGGVGWTSGYSGPYGTIPNHPDPTPGESMIGKRALDLWIALHHRVSGSPDTIVTYRRSFEELAHDPSYHGGRKPKGLESIGDIDHGLGAEDGGFSAASIDITLSEAVDRWIRTILGDDDIEDDEIEVYLASPTVQAAGDPARVLMRAVVEGVKTSSNLQAILSAVDVLFSIIGPFGERPVWPFWTFGDVFDEATCPADVRARVIPVLYGEKSDENPTSGRSKGLCSLYYCGTFLKTTGIVRPDTPGSTLAAVVAELQASVTAHTTVADWGSIIGVGDAGALEDLGTVPATYTALAEVIGFADLDALLGMGTTAAPATERYGFFAAGLMPWFKFYNLYGSDSGGGDPNAKHDRVLIDVASRSDVLMYGVNDTSPYAEFTAPDGRVFWLAGIWVHESSPLFQDHVNGVVNMTVNAIGIEDVGDGTGLPLMHAYYCEHHWIENFLINNTTSGLWTTNIDYPQWPDGTAKVRSSRFFARQAYTADQIGGSPATIGLMASWYVETAKNLNDHFKDWNTLEADLGSNGYGQMTLGYIDVTEDTSTWPIVSHVTDIYGSVDATYGDQRETSATMYADWDPDKQKWRLGPILRTSDTGIARLKGHRKPGQPLYSPILNDATQVTWLLDQRLLRLGTGQIPVTIVGKVDLLDYDVDSPGIRLTTTEGRGASGYTLQPMRIKRRRFTIADRLVTDTLIDIADQMAS